MQDQEEQAAELPRPRHIRAARMLGYTLTLGTQDAWWGMVPVLMARLTPQERASLAFMALKSLGAADAALTARAALGGERDRKAAA